MNSYVRIAAAGQITDHRNVPSLALVLLLNLCAPAQDRTMEAPS